MEKQTLILCRNHNWIILTAEQEKIFLSNEIGSARCPKCGEIVRKIKSREKNNNKEDEDNYSGDIL